MILTGDDLRLALQTLHRSWQKTWRLKSEQGKSTSKGGRSCCEMGKGNLMPRAKTKHLGIGMSPFECKSKQEMHRTTSSDNVIPRIFISAITASCSIGTSIAQRINEQTQQTAS